MVATQVERQVSAAYAEMPDSREEALNSKATRRLADLQAARNDGPSRGRADDGAPCGRKCQQSGTQLACQQLVLQRKPKVSHLSNARWKHNRPFTLFRLRGRLGTESLIGVTESASHTIGTSD